MHAHSLQVPHLFRLQVERMPQEVSWLAQSHLTFMILAEWQQ